MTQLPMGATNSVAQFVQIVTKILQNHIPDMPRQFVDDVEVKNPKMTYNNKEVALGIRRFMLEHIQSLDRVFADIKRARTTIVGSKSQFCMSGLKVMGYVCDANEKHPDAAKVIKILDWPNLVNPIGTQAFLDICVYYQIWIFYFVIIAEPIYCILKKGIEFV